MRRRGELLERTFAHAYETGALRRLYVRGNLVGGLVLLQARQCCITTPTRSTSAGTRADMAAASVRPLGPVPSLVNNRVGRILWVPKRFHQPTR